MIDGAENNWPSFESARHYEVARFFSLTEHLLTPEVLVMSKTRWDRLSPPDRELVRAAAKESVGEMRRLWDLRVEEARAAITASGVAVNEVDKAAFSELMKPVWAEFVTTPQQKSLVERIVAMGGQ